MAEELVLRDGQVPVKVRNPWGVALLPFITSTLSTAVI